MHTHKYDYDSIVHVYVQMIYTYDEYMKLHDTYILRLIIFLHHDQIISLSWRKW